MPKLWEERHNRLYLDRFEDRQIARPYRDGNTVSRLTLGQLSRYLVDHNCVVDEADTLVDAAYRDAMKAIAISERIRQSNGRRGRS